MTQLMETRQVPRAAERRRPVGWVRILLGGGVLWIATVVITFVTGNVNLVPTVILLGSFLVPVTFVVRAFGRTDGVLTAQRIFIAFVCGGVLGVLGASVLESALLPHASGLGNFGVGLIEEAVKLAALWCLARRLPRYTVRDGMVLGAAVGFGFAALESAGYAFTAMFTSDGLSLLSVVETEALRGVLAPVGHGLWTAILGGALFATAAHARRGRPRLRASLVVWYLVVSVLHALWDAAAGMAVWLTLVLTGDSAQWTLVRVGDLPNVTQAQVHLSTVLTWVLMGLDAVVGLLILLVRRKRIPARTWSSAGPLPDGSATVEAPR